MGWTVQRPQRRKRDSSIAHVPGRSTMISMPPDPRLLVGWFRCVSKVGIACNLQSWKRRFWWRKGKVVLLSPTSCVLTRLRHPEFFCRDWLQPMFTRFWHVLFFLVGFSAFAPFGSLAAACGLARRRRAHVKVPIGECRISKTSDLYRVLVSQ